jgi:hypothetical protein
MLHALLKKHTPGDTASEGADDDDLPPRPLTNLEKQAKSEGFSDLGGIVQGMGREKVVGVGKQEANTAD